MLIDSGSIRRKARRDYAKVLRDLDLVRAEAERFESEDKPQYAKWLNANFGALLTEIRELHDKLFHAQQLVDEVQQEFVLGNYRSILKAYKNVMHRRDHPEEVEQEEKLSEEEESAFRKACDEIFGEEDESYAGREPDESRNGPRIPIAKQSSRVKDLYRKLVRLLHPDKGAKRTAKEVEWWHLTQEAYQTGNIEQLELILTLVEIEEKGSNEASVSVLAQLTAEFKKSLKALKRRIATFKKDIAWNFSKLTDFSTLLRITRVQLRADRDRLLWIVQRYESQIQSWETASAVSGKRVRARRGSWQDEEWF